MGNCGLNTYGRKFPLKEEEFNYKEKLFLECLVTGSEVQE